jgi:hypothetical protein
VRKGVHSQVWLVELHPEYDHLADGVS